eukprot:542054_1
MFNFFKKNKKLLIGGAIASVAISYYYFSYYEQSSTKTKTRPTWDAKWKKFRENNELAPWENTYPNREINYLSHFNDSNTKQLNIFVPLCGASNDMILMDEYFTKSKKKVKIIGIEISKNAVEYFFESKLKQKDYITKTKDNVIIYESKDGKYEFYVQSIFDNNVQTMVKERAKQIGYIDFIYDRASLNCIKPKQRTEYISFLDKILKNNGKILLSTLRFNKMASKKEYLNRGPYSWTNEEVNEFFKDIVKNEKDGIKLLGAIRWSDSEYDDEKTLGERMGIDSNDGFCDIYSIHKSKL